MIKKISHELRLSRQTTGKHRATLALKLRATTDIAIYLAAVELGLLQPPTPVSLHRR